MTQDSSGHIPGSTGPESNLGDKPALADAVVSPDLTASLPLNKDAGRPASKGNERTACLIVGVGVFLLTCAAALASFVLLPYAMTGIPKLSLPAGVPVIALPALNARSTATAEAEATRLAQAAQVTLSTASQWPLVVSDPFDLNFNGWHTHEYTNEYGTGKAEVTGGHYRWDIQAKEPFQIHDEPRLRPLSDFYLVVQGKQVSGATSAEFGFIFRSDGMNFYRFVICDCGEFDLELRNDGDWTTLISWRESPAILSGQDNRLAVIAQGSHYTFFINDRYVAQADDSTLSGGRVGVVTGIGEAGDQAVIEFDNFEVRSPDVYPTETAQAERTVTAQAGLATRVAAEAQETATAIVAQRQETATAIVVEGQETATAIVVQAQESATSERMQATSTALALKMGTEQAADATATFQAGKTGTVEAARAAKTLTVRAASTAAAFGATSTASAQWPVVFADSFTRDTGAWWVGNTSDAFGTSSKSLSDGKYVWNMQAIKGALLWQPVDTRPLTSLYLSMEGRLLNGPRTARYGLVFRVDSGAANCYYLAINDNQRLLFAVRNAGKWNHLIDRSGLQAIRPGAVNKLSVSAVGSHFQFFVNDQFVGAWDDATLTTGEAGLGMELQAGDSATVEFDRFEVRAP